MSDKQQLAAMGEHMAEQAAQPMCMAKRIEELEAQVRVMGGLLLEAQESVKECANRRLFADERAELIFLVRKINDALSGKLPTPIVPEGWQLEALDNDRMVVRKDGVGFYVASLNDENIASTILHALASDMLAAAPSPDIAK